MTFTGSRKIAQQVGYLAGRWQDEKEYEDWAEYKAAMRKLVPEGGVFVKATKRPFGFVFTLEGKEWRYRVERTAIVEEYRVL